MHACFNFTVTLTCSFEESELVSLVSRNNIFGALDAPNKRLLIEAQAGSAARITAPTWCGCPVEQGIALGRAGGESVLLAHARAGGLIVNSEGLTTTRNVGGYTVSGQSVQPAETAAIR